jgi:hypothetical protein
MLQGGMASVGTIWGRVDCQVLAWWRHCVFLYRYTIHSKHKLLVSSTDAFVTRSLLNNSKPKVKIKVYLCLSITIWWHTEGLEVKLQAFLTLELNAGEWSVSCSSCFTHEKTAPQCPKDRKLSGAQNGSRHDGEENQTPVCSFVSLHFVTTSW